MALYGTAPVLFQYGCKIVRLSKSLVLKGGVDLKPSEAETMKFAATNLNIPVPKVRRVFSRRIPEEPGQDTCFIVMDYICGPTVEQCWASLNKAEKESVASQVADMIERMQATTINHAPPGPIGWRDGEPFQGPWFTDYGAGPFTTLQNLEEWCNHKLDICLRFKQAPSNTPRFEFQGSVLTHQDIAPRNLIRDPSGRVWLLDWGYAGIYPRGFEQAVLSRQASNKEFSEMVLSRLSDRHEQMSRQFFSIGYALTTAALL